MENPPTYIPRNYTEEILQATRSQIELALSPAAAELWKLASPAKQSLIAREVAAGTYSPADLNLAFHTAKMLRAQAPNHYAALTAVAILQMEISL